MKFNLKMSKLLLKIDNMESDAGIIVDDERIDVEIRALLESVARSSISEWAWPKEFINVQFWYLK